MVKDGLALLMLTLASCSALSGGATPSPSPRGTLTANAPLAISGALNGQFLPVATDGCGGRAATPGSPGTFKAQLRGTVNGDRWTFVVTVAPGYHGPATYLNGQGHIALSDGWPPAVPRVSYRSGSDAAIVVFDDQHSGGVDASLTDASGASQRSGNSVQIAGTFHCS